MRFVFIIALYAINSCASSLTFEDYMAQVRKSNGGYIAAESASAGARQAILESELKFMTQFIASAQYTNNSQITIAPSVQGAKTLTNQGSFGFSKLSKSLGTQMQIQYAINNTSIYGGSAIAIPVYFQNGLMLTLNQPLWQNFMGRKTRFDSQATASTTLSSIYSQKFASKTAIMQAEQAFWSLATIRTILHIQSDNITNSKTMRNINHNKKQLDLIDDVDLISSNAKLSSNKADFDSYRNQEITASHAFNTARGVESNIVNEEIFLPSVSYIMSLKMPKFLEVREDLKASKALSEAQEEKYLSIAESYAPTFNATLTASQNGRNESWNNTLSQSFGQQYPYIVAGLTFAYTLDSSSVKSVQSGYRKQADAAKVTYKQQVVDAQNTWLELSHKFDESRNRLEILQELTTLQKKQIDSEITLFKKGRSSSANIYSLKQQNASTMIIQSQLIGDIMNLYAQLKTYSDSAD